MLKGLKPAMIEGKAFPVSDLLAFRYTISTPANRARVR